MANGSRELARLSLALEWAQKITIVLLVPWAFWISSKVVKLQESVVVLQERVPANIRVILNEELREHESAFHREKEGN